MDILCQLQFLYQVANLWQSLKNLELHVCMQILQSVKSYNTVTAYHYVKDFAH